MIIYDIICFLHIYYYLISLEVQLAFELNFPLNTGSWFYNYARELGIDVANKLIE